MLQKHIDKKDFIKINRRFGNIEVSWSGFLLAFSKDFLLLQVNNDFQLDGYIVIPKTKFDSIRCNKYDNTSKKIYKQEGLLDAQYGIDHTISLQSWQDLFTDLKRTDHHVIVECEDKDEPDFIIGPIKRIYKSSVSIQYYDPAGQLENKLTSVSYNEITTVQFADRYSTKFRKYLKESGK